AVPETGPHAVATTPVNSTSLGSSYFSPSASKTAPQKSSVCANTTERSCLTSSFWAFGADTTACEASVPSASAVAHGDVAMTTRHTAAEDSRIKSQLLKREVDP